MSTPAFRVVIPARYASTRLPAKPLVDLGGKPMIVRTLERARLCGAAEVWVATDHPEVERAVREAGGQVVMTREDHPSGTDRLAEVAAKLGWRESDLVVNVQGDEPLIEPALIRDVAQALADAPQAAIATAAHPIRSAEALFNPAVVKVVCNAAGDALYFSRAPIPWPRDAFAQDRSRLPEGLGALHHVGLYAYRVSFLHRYAQLSPAPLEKFEMLEQLRALWHGYPIRVLTLDAAPAAGVDTEDDLARVRAIFEAAPAR